MQRRTLLSVTCLGLVAILLAVQLSSLVDDPSFLQPYDYLEYWSAGRATLEGRNPYDGDVLYPMQQTAGTVYDFPLMMWNPPWTLPLAMPVGAASWRAGQLGWFAAHLAAVIASAVLLWRVYDGPRHLLWLPVGLGLTFAPVGYLLLMGQISGFMLLGLAGFLAAVRANRYVLAGVLAALTAVKPHLLILFALALGLEALRTRPVRKTVVCGALVLAVAGLVPLYWNPDVWSQYRHATQDTGATSHPTLDRWVHPTLGYAIRKAIPGEPFAAMFLPAVAVTAVFAVYWGLRRRAWSWPVEVPRLTIASLLAAPYGAWAYDMTLLLVPMVQAAVWLTRSRADRRVLAGLAVAYLAWNGLTLAAVREANSTANPWIAPAALAGYLFVGWLTRPETARRAVPSPALTSTPA